MNKVLEVINNRTSLRKYADKPILQEDRDKIIESALRAPTAGNMMLYSILVIDDQTKKEKLSQTCDNQPFIAKAPLVMVFLADLQRWYDYFRLSGVKDKLAKQNKDFIGPEKADLLLACSDALVAAQTAVIAAESLNIGSCYIGDIMENYEIHQELFNLPPFVFPITMLVMGYYPEKRPTLKPRFVKKHIVYNDTYQQQNENDLTEMFRARENSFNPANFQDIDNFGQLMYFRKQGADFFQEMIRSVNKAIENWDGKKL